MDTLRMTDHGLLPQVDVDDEELQSLVAGQVKRVEGVLSEFRERVRAIESDPGLNRQGRRERKRELAEEFAPRMEEALNLDEAKRLDSRVKTLESRLFEKGPNVEIDLEHEDRIRQQARETRELIRRRLEEAEGPEERQRIADRIRDAVEQNDAVTLIALRDAPPAFPVLEGDDLPDLREIRAAHAEEHFPSKVQEARNYRRTVSTIHHNISQSREEFRELAGVDPVEEPRFHVVEEGSMEPVEPFADEEGETETESADEPAGEPVTA